MVFQGTLSFSKACLLSKKKSIFVGLCFNWFDLSFLRG